MERNNILTKKELDFYIKADYMMGRGRWKPSFSTRIKELLFPDYINRYLVYMRKTCYYSNFSKISMGGLKFLFYKALYRRLGIKLGFSIGYKCFGYGLVIPHYGTIVVGDDNRCGNYCVLHTSICISGEGGGKKIGDALYASSGSRIYKPITLGNNVQVCSNSVVNKSFLDDNIVLGGMPAMVKKEKVSFWYEGWEAEIWKNKVEKLRICMGL